MEINRIDLNGVRVALKVAEHASFVRASEELGLPTTTVSAKVQSLERSLGMKLFQRSTRRVSLTEAGELFFQHAKRAADAIEDAVATVSYLSERPRGRLRIATPTLFTQQLLPQILPRFFARYPDIRLSVEATNVLPDLIEQGLDLGICVGAPRRGEYSIRALFSVSQGIYTSPLYAGQFGLPETVSGLANHKTLGLGFSRSQIYWDLVSGAKRERAAIDPLAILSDVSAIHSLARAGLGLGLLPLPLCEEDVRTGRLVRVLPAWTTSPVEVFAVYPSRKLLAVKVRVFLDYLCECLNSTR
jgi:DNA-binding transcriptional LysR family regulator